MKRRLGLTAVLIFTLILAGLSLFNGCKMQDRTPGASSLPGSSLDNTFWTMTSMAKAKPLPGAEITAGFINGQLSGSTGCNNYFAVYETQGERLILTNTGVTEMACLEPEGVMEVESRFLDYFYQVDRFNLTEEELQLITGDGEYLIFAPRPR
jgi:heat shock protein HslJ